MNFIPDTPEHGVDVPFYDDVTSESGWQGHGTNKTVETLQAEISACISRLGGLVTGFTKGKFGDRDGFRIIYSMKSIDGVMTPGRIDVAALPIKPSARARKGTKTKKEKSLRMCLYMLRMALDGTWFLQQLSPGYNALMPWMLVDENTTLSEAWSDKLKSNLLMPPEDFVDGEIVEENNGNS